MENRTTNIKLINDALKGNQQAYQQLYHRYKRNLFMICLRYAKDKSTAQDYLQEAFISIFKNLSHFDKSKGVFESWAKRITINACLMDLRKTTMYSVGIAAAEAVETKEVDVLSKLSVQEMLQIVQQLPQGYKTVFNMYVIDGFSHKEIAAQLNITINTSKSQLRKAKLLLQKKITNNYSIYQQVHG